MIEQITADEEKELEELLLIMVPLQEIAQHITTSNDAQDVINQKSIKLLENSKKIHNLMLSKARTTTVNHSFHLLFHSDEQRREASGKSP